jgi:protein required for attachment to host cells
MKKPKIEFNPWVRWYVLGNQTEAAIYRSTREMKFKFIERLHHHNGKLKEGDLDSDAPGTGFSSAGDGTIRHSLDHSFHHHEQSVKRFAKSVARYLDRASFDSLFTELILVCEPHFLGLLRAELSDRVLKMVTHEVNREYSYGSDQEMYSLILKAMEEIPHVPR